MEDGNSSNNGFPLPAATGSGKIIIYPPLAAVTPHTGDRINGVTIAGVFDPTANGEAIYHDRAAGNWSARILGIK